MTASTHLITAAISITTINIFSGDPCHPAPIAVAMFASLTPDIDHPESHLGRLYKPLSGHLYRKFGHRTLTHSIFGWLFAAILFYPLRWVNIDVNLYRAALTGVISHALLDMTNIDGVALTYPLAKHHRWVFPADPEYRIKAGSPKEGVFRFVGLLVMVGTLALNIAGGQTLFHSFLGTPAAIGRDYAQQLRNGYRLVVQIEGIWGKQQAHIKAPFDVIASTDSLIYVRRPTDPRVVYQITGSDSSAIVHARLKIVRRIRAQARTVTVKFNGEGWKTDLALHYPTALVSGYLTTRAQPPAFGIDEFATIQPTPNGWKLTYAPIELVDQALQKSGSRIRGEIQIRYWKEKRENDGNYPGR